MIRPRTIASRVIATLLPALVVALLAVTAAEACPACKETVRGQAESGLSAGFNATVFGMLGMVFTLVAFVVAIIVRAHRRSASQIATNLGTRSDDTPRSHGEQSLPTLNGSIPNDHV